MNGFTIQTVFVLEVWGWTSQNGNWKAALGRTQVKEGNSKKEKYLFPRRQSEDMQACLYHPSAPARGNGLCWKL